VALCAGAAPAAATPGDIVASFAVSGLSLNGPRGLAFDGTSLYAVADNRGRNQVRISKFTYGGGNASVVASFNCPPDVYWAMDLAWRPGRIYIANDLPSPTSRAKVVVVNDETGSVTNNFTGPFAAGTHLNGLSWSGSRLYASSYESNLVYKLTAGGSVVSSFAAGHAHNHGLASGDDKLWLVAGRPYFDAAQYSSAGSRLRSFTFDVADEYVGGACWASTLSYTMFISTFTADRLIYEVETAPFSGPGIGVAPTSLGRIKALYR